MMILFSLKMVSTAFLHSFKALIFFVLMVFALVDVSFMPQNYKKQETKPIADGNYFIAQKKRTSGGSPFLRAL